MNPPARLSELILALDMPSEEFRTYFDRKTGTLVSVEDMMLSSLEDGEEEDPDDLADWQKEEYETAREIVADDGSRFIPPPDKFEFHEYRVMEEFIRSLKDEKAANQRCTRPGPRNRYPPGRTHGSGPASFSCAISQDLLEKINLRRILNIISANYAQNILLLAAKDPIITAGGAEIVHT